MHKTKFNSLLNRISALVEYFIFSSWKRRSTALLALLLGFYLGSSLTEFILTNLGERTLSAFFMVTIVELTVRIRNNFKQDKLPISIVILDNLRVGSVYAVVLEAFKLGS